jgi:hypothetical protein
LALGAHVWSLALVLLIARAAFQAHRVARVASLRFFAAGFLLLAVSHVAGFALEFATGDASAIRVGAFDRFDVLFWTYHLATVAGYVAIFASFGRHPFKWTPVLAPVLLIAAPVLELVALVLLFFIVLHAGLNHIARARAGSLQTAFGFFLLLLGRFLFLLEYSPLNPRNLWGEAPTMLGYLLLYLAITRPRWTA